MVEQEEKQVKVVDLVEDLQLDTAYMYWETYQIGPNTKDQRLSFPSGILRLQRLRVFPFAYREVGSADNWLPISLYIGQKDSDKRIELVQERKFQRKYQQGTLDDSGQYSVSPKTELIPETSEIELRYQPNAGDYLEFSNPNNFPVGFIFVYQMQKTEEFATIKNYQSAE